MDEPIRYRLYVHVPCRLRNDDENLSDILSTIESSATSFKFASISRWTSLIMVYRKDWHIYYVLYEYKIEGHCRIEECNKFTLYEIL